MAPRRILDWYGPLLLGAVAGTVLLVGFALGATGRIGEPLGPPPAPVEAMAGGQYHLVALGDSITSGVGDRDGGYVARLAESLRRRGRRLTVTNLAVSGDDTQDLARRLEAEHTRREVARARLILVSISGNDLSRSLRGDDEDPGAALAAAGQRLRALVARLRALNATAPIRLIGLYNPFEIAAGEEPKARAQLLDWNVALERAALDFRGVLMVPVADLFLDRPDRLAGDRYHPGPRGHEAIAHRVLATLREGD